MKRTLFLLAAVFSVATVFSSCEPDNEDKNKSDKVYTNEEQKEKLQDVATELMNKFNPEEQRKAVELSDYLTQLYDDYDWDFSDLEGQYKGDYGFLYSVNCDVRQAVYGDPTSNFATNLLKKASKERSTEIYKFANVNAVWEANETEHKWEYKGEGNGGLVLKFKGPKGVQCEAKLWGVDGTITYKGTYEAPTGKYYIRLNERQVRLPEDMQKYYDEYVFWPRYEYEGKKYPIYGSWDDNDNRWYYYIEAYDKHYVSEEDYKNGWCEYEGNKYYWIEREYGDQPFEATLPNQVNFYLKEGATEHINYAMKFDVKKSDHFNFDFTLKITNLTIAQGLKVSKNAAGYVFSAKLGKEDLIKAVFDLKNCGLVDKANNQDWLDWMDMYYDMFMDESLKTGSAVAQVDILGGKLTIKTSNIDGGIKFYKDYEALWDKYKNDDSFREKAPYNMELALLFNNFLKVDMYYGDSKSVQAQMKWEASSHDEEDWDGNTHQIWDCAPIVYFPIDESSYNFGKYFTEKRFNTVINAAEDLLKKYIRLSERWGDHADDIDF
ncbi:MAG: hypothetical protein K2H68_02395 [Bacteroidales bacterium]|nr:hypothetical protein [Bacteroidales bacterium]